MSRARNVCFTLQISSEDDLLVLDPSLWAHCTYAIWQLEQAPTTGQLHYQGYIEFDAPVRYSTLHTYEGLEGAHFEARRGTAKQASDYCRKEESRIEGPWTWGTLSSQGKRNDIADVCERLKKGQRLEEIVEDHPGTVIRYQRGLQWYASFNAPQRNWAMEILVLVGPSGVGKSRKAFEDYPGAYWKPPGKWWPGYHGQETVVLDEFYGSSMAFSELLVLLDRNPLSVETKGGSTSFTSRRIVFTSNQHPQYWYNAEKTHQGPWEGNPLNRRLQEFGQIIEMGHVPAPVRLDYGAPQDDNPFSINEIDLLVADPLPDFEFEEGFRLE